jgi:hypothetical protein
MGLAGLMLAGAAACAHAQAAAPERKGLDVPQPPPRVVVPPTVDLSVDPPTPPAPTSPAPVAPVKPPSATAVKPPDKPATNAPTTTPPVPEVSTTPLEMTSDVSALETETKALMARASRDLGRVDTASLSADARAQYQRAQGFLKQAESAMREKNLTYARNMAEKAAALASQLPKTRLSDPLPTGS